MLKNDRVIQWMNVIRRTKGKEQNRILECFWESQITSKQWIIDTLTDKSISCYSSVYVFGGWYGVLGGMLRDTYSLNPDITFIVEDMQNVKFKELPSVIINTSTEHINQSVYNTWVSALPKFVPIVLQGNNYFSHHEHIRCSNNLTEFKRMNPLDSIVYEGELDCKQFTRYMTIGYML
jgi:hypothetical protein